MDKLVQTITYLTKWSLDYSEVGTRVSDRVIEFPDKQSVAVVTAYLKDMHVSYSIKDNYILVGESEDVIVTLSNKCIVGKEIVTSYEIVNAL